MFESLDERIKHDVQQETTAGERWLRWLAGLVIGFVVIVGLYFGVQMLE